MKRLICYLVAGMCLAANARAQQCTDCRYLSDVFDSVSVTTVHFGAGLNSEGDTQQLYMDIYEPVGDTMTNRPVLVFAFGGGFIQGDRFELHATKTCERFAKAGYVAVSMDYRYNFDIAYGLLNGPNKEALRVFFRAVQDMRAAIQYMKYSADLLGNPYNINPDMIFNAGASSGGITALAMAYGDKSSEWMQIADTTAIDLYGGFNATSANGTHSAYDWGTVGCISIAGALLSTSWMEAGDIPVILAHGDADETVPYRDEATLNSFLVFANVQLQGSYMVDTAATERGICSHLYTMVGEDHPSNSWPDYNFQSIYSRMLPRMKAIMDGKNFCCAFDATIAGDTLKGVLNAGNELDLTATVDSDPGNLAYHWCAYPCRGGGPQTGATATVYPEPDTVQYYVLTAENGTCLSTDYVAVKIVDSLPPTGLVNVSADVDFGIYPNPARREFFVNFLSSGELAVMDLTGRVVVPVQTVVGPQVIDASGLASGAYLVRVTTNKGTQVQQIIIE